MFTKSSRDASQQQSKLAAAKKHHSRSQSSSSASTSAALNANTSNSSSTNDTFKLNDANSRGWLESSGVQVNPSRSLEKKSHHRKQTKELSQKGNCRNVALTSKALIKCVDILGAVSVEDIFKLTEMTARLPEVTPQASTSKSKHKNHHRHTSEPASTTQKPPEMPTASPPTATTGTPTEVPVITTSPDLITSSSSKSSLSSSLEPVQEHKRSSWLHRKKKDTNKSAAASIVDEFYQKNPKEDNVLSRIHSINITPLSDIKFGHKKAPNQQKESDASEPEGRRHSFDNHQIDAQENGLETTEEAVLEEAKRDVHERRPDFFLHMSNEGINEERDQAHAAIEKQQPEEQQDDEEKEEVITMKFDYFTLSTEVKGLIDVYEHKGKVERKRMVVRFRKGSSLASSSDNTSSLMQEEDDDEDDYYDDEEEVDEDDTNNKNVVYYRDLIVGECESINYRNNPVRDIAILSTTPSDNIEFIKLIQLSSGDPPDQGPLLDLHVSMFGDQNSDMDKSNEAEEFDIILQNIQSRLVILDAFKKESNVGCQLIKASVSECQLMRTI